MLPFMGPWRHSKRLMLPCQFWDLLKTSFSKRFSSSFGASLLSWDLGGISFLGSTESRGRMDTQLCTSEYDATGAYSSLGLAG